MPMGLKTKGFPETQAALIQLRQTVATDATRGAVRAGANVIRDEMAAQAPMLDEETANSTALDPGVLKTEIRVAMGRVDKEGFIVAEIGPSEEVAHVARWVEYGHRLVKGGYSSFKRGRLQGSGKQIGEVPAHPFLRPAYETSWQKSIQEYAADLKRRLARWVK